MLAWEITMQIILDHFDIVCAGIILAVLIYLAVVR